MIRMMWTSLGFLQGLRMGIAERRQTPGGKFYLVECAVCGERLNSVAEREAHHGPEHGEELKHE